MNTTAASAIVVALSLGFVAGVSAAPKSYKSAGPTDEESRQFHEVVAKYKSQAAESCKAAMDMDISPAIADFSSVLWAMKSDKARNPISIMSIIKIDSCHSILCEFYIAPEEAVTRLSKNQFCD